jgi:hypothetical protein
MELGKRELLADKSTKWNRELLADKSTNIIEQEENITEGTEADTRKNKMEQGKHDRQPRKPTAQRKRNKMEQGNMTDNRENQQQKKRETRWNRETWQITDIWGNYSTGQE